MNNNGLYLFKAFLRYKLCSKKIVLDYKLTKRAFNFLLNEIENYFLKSKINPGEMSGSIAA